MILKSVCLIFVLGLINIDFCAGYKCSFYREFFQYSCIVYPDRVSYVTEKHYQDSNDNNITVIKYNGYLNEITRLTQTELSFFKRFNKVYAIYFDGIVEVPEWFFSSYSELSTLELTDSKLTTLPENIFANQGKLWELNLSRNKINFLPQNIFKSLVNLARLNLNENDISVLPSKIFDSLEKLDRLEIKYNKISDLPKDIFKPLKNLQYLHLENNRLTTIHSDSFGTIKRLSIFLEKNPIKAMDEKMLANEPDLHMPEWSCSTKAGYIYGSEVPEILKKCFENYQPREE